MVADKLVLIPFDDQCSCSVFDLALWTVVVVSPCNDFARLSDVFLNIMSHRLVQYGADAALIVVEHFGQVIAMLVKHLATLTLLWDFVVTGSALQFGITDCVELPFYRVQIEWIFLWWFR